MLNANKLKLILALMCLMACITTVQQTYAKYISSASAGANMTIARWRILVNNEDIHNGTSIENIISPTFEETAYTQEGVIAPESTGYFDIVVDSTNTDLSFSYQINALVNENSSVTDLIATGYSVNGGEIINFTNDRTINGSILKQSNIVINTIRVYIKWNDGEGSLMDNTADTDASYNEESTPLLDVNLSFIQLTNTPQPTTEPITQ